MLFGAVVYDEVEPVPVLVTDVGGTGPACQVSFDLVGQRVVIHPRGQTDPICGDVGGDTDLVPIVELDRVRDHAAGREHRVALDVGGVVAVGGRVLGHRFSHVPHSFVSGRPRCPVRGILGGSVEAGAAPIGPDVGIGTRELGDTDPDVGFGAGIPVIHLVGQDFRFAGVLEPQIRCIRRKRAVAEIARHIVAEDDQRREVDQSFRPRIAGERDLHLLREREVLLIVRYRDRVARRRADVVVCGHQRDHDSLAAFLYVRVVYWCYSDCAGVGPGRQKHRAAQCDVVDTTAGRAADGIGDSKILSAARRGSGDGEHAGSGRVLRNGRCRGLDCQCARREGDVGVGPILAC